ncbi:MAG: SRPBCC domain-containing protein [Thermocrispum sp.]
MLGARSRSRLHFDTEDAATAVLDQQIDLRAGGGIEMVPTGPAAPVDAKRMTGTILVWQPPHVFEHEWRQPVIEDSVVRYELARDGAGTLLTFTHRGLGVVNARGFTPGTHAHLDRLECHLAAADLPNWSRRYDEVAARCEGS